MQLICESVKWSLASGYGIHNWWGAFSDQQVARGFQAEPKTADSSFFKSRPTFQNINFRRPHNLTCTLKNWEKEQ